MHNRILLFAGILAFVCYQIVNFFYFPMETVFPDESRFVKRAINFSVYGVFGHLDAPTAWEMPLTSLFLGTLYSILGSEVYLVVFVRVFQSILLILQAYFIYRLSLIMFQDKRVAIATFSVMLFYPYFVYYQGLLLSETMFNTFLVLSFYYIYRWYETNFVLNRYFLLANVFLVLSIYVKATLSLLVPFLLPLFFILNNFKEIKKFMMISLSTIFLYALFMSPWWIRNYNIFDTFIPFTTTSAWNLYLGNNPKNLNGGIDWSKDVDKVVVARIKNIDSELERNNAFKNEAVKFILNNPDRFFELMYLKLKRFYSIVPNADTYSQGYYKWISIISYGPIFILFVISTFIFIRKFTMLSAIYILFAYFTLLHTVIIASLRYRLPLEPFMILLALPVFMVILEKMKIISKS